MSLTEVESGGMGREGNARFGKETLVGKMPLKKEKIIKKTIGTFTMFGMFVLVPLAWLAFYSPGLLALSILLLGVLFAGVFAYQTAYYKGYFYDLTDDGLVISKGVFSTWKAVIPLAKVQDVYLDQDLLDRIFGLYDLHLSTATETSGREAHIDGLPHESALKIRDLVLSELGVNKEKLESAGIEIEISQRARSYVLLTGLSGGIVFVFFLIQLIIEYPPAILLAPLAIGATVAWSYLDFTALRYELRENGVYIKRGYFIPSESFFLFRNIQDVDEKQNLFERMFGISTLVVKTMTSASAAAARMQYIPSSKARDLREKILELCRKSTADASQELDKNSFWSKGAKSARVGKPGFGMRQQSAPDFETVANPFVPNFARGALYSGGIAFAAMILIAMAVGVVLATAGFGLWSAIIVGGAAALGTFILCSQLVNAYIRKMSFSYEMAKDYITVQIKFISVSRKQINYKKIQDIEVGADLLSKFAGLATVAFESGSKELMDEGGSREVAISAISANESIPALEQQEAQKLCRMVARQMGCSMAGLDKLQLLSSFPLDKRKIIKKTVGFAIGYIFINAICTLLIWIFAPFLLALAAAAWVILTLVIAAKYFYEKEYYARYAYAENSDCLMIRKGVLGYRQLVIPFSKIQDVFVDRDLLDLVFGLYDVYVSTATSRSITNAHIDGLDEKSAQAIALLLMRRIRESS